MLEVFFSGERESFPVGSSRRERGISFVRLNFDLFDSRRTDVALLKVLCDVE